jgi:hypothetical protein
MGSTVAPERGCWQGFGSRTPIVHGFFDSQLTQTGNCSKDLALVLAESVPDKSANDEENDEPLHWAG